ncbi:WYL domain-containing protein [Novosphingobium flavum]|uniref:WYL domain-containing protein n=1 Tax=Novosphingobium aerophilum TaxID=2839843 RepID=UPI0016397026|nr:WYL domain-containing protein [Novosphingobium aerophilum]MBC2663672.1 WYL domain-containing protein [Novosphingobium aerophilum]
MAADKPSLRWGVEQKLQFIEFRLFWEGHVNRGDLIDKFGISQNQASGDLNRYIALAPDNMVYDKSGKTYVRSPAFSPHFMKPDATQYLAQVRSVAEGIVAPEDAWIGNLPAFDAIPAPARGIDPAVLRSILIAIRRREAVEVRYQSMSSPDPEWRWIAPHALAFDGFRWHARSFCEKSGEYRDFVISRIIETRQSRSTQMQTAADADWDEIVQLEIGPHPALSQNQKRVIKLDYGMQDGRVRIPVRRALFYYALRRLGLDTAPSAREPQDQQIVLLNRGGVHEDHG